LAMNKQIDKRFFIRQSADGGRKQTNSDQICDQNLFVRDFVFYLQLICGGHRPPLQGR
jgi:hypothetical protein